MAKIENVVMTVGSTTVMNSNNEPCRNISVSARFRFTPEEIGTQFLIKMSVHSSDSPFTDPDSASNSFSFFGRNYTQKIGDLDFSGGNGGLSTTALSLLGTVVYEKLISPTATEMNLAEERLVLESRLDEDPNFRSTVIPLPGLPSVRIREPQKDELFVKVQLCVESSSPVQIATISRRADSNF